jgi:hypothetical protein
MKHPTHNSILSWDVPCSARLPASFFAVLEEPSARLGAMFGAKGTGATKVQQRATNVQQKCNNVRNERHSYWPILANRS